MKSFQIQVSSTNKLTVLERDGSSNNTFETTGTFSTGAWTHFAYTRSASNVKLYINGTLDVNHSASNAINAGSTQDITIGNQAGASVFFDGRMSVLRIYNTTLTDSEVAQNFRADCFLSYSSIYSTNLNANFDAANYTSGAWVDSVNSNSGTVNNAAFDKELGNFFDFNRSDDNENITVSDSASLSPTSALSVEVIVRPETFANHQRIVWKNASYGLYASASGVYTFFINSTSNTVQGTLNETGKFKHIVGTFDGSNIKIYINGILQATTSLSASVTDNSNAFTIGGDGTTARYYDGQIGVV